MKRWLIVMLAVGCSVVPSDKVGTTDSGLPPGENPGPDETPGTSAALTLIATVECEAGERSHTLIDLGGAPPHKVVAKSTVRNDDLSQYGLSESETWSIWDQTVYIRGDQGLVLCTSAFGKDIELWAMP